MSPAEHVGEHGEVLAIVYENQEVELINAKGKPVFVKGTQEGFDVMSTESYENYGPDEKKAYLQLQYASS